MSRPGFVIADAPARDFLRAVELAADVAATHADDVDRTGRFPVEAITAIKAARLMSMMLPRALGGEDASLTDVAQVTTALARSCASTGMIFAMHQIKLSSLISHGQDSPWHMNFMRAIAAGQLLLASATTEAGIGGDLRNSVCAVETEGRRARLVKDATVISYALDADAILATARREAAAPSSDQVMVAITKDQYRLQKTTEWDTLGMRGTRSEGFILSAEFGADQVFPKPFADIAAQSMLATSHLLWSSVWLGIANGAVARAQAFVKGEARKKPDVKPPGMLRLAEATNMLHLMRANLAEGLQRFYRARRDPDELNAVGFSVAMNNVKLASSEMLIKVVNHALLICGIAGYRNDTPFSLGRYLRDAHSAPLMISNDRILLNQGNLLLVSRADTPIGG
ncbi:MAG: acyl-CoA/acyl-ACP dehydrogenase [Proteobacteria bacterium]|nr:acyl-CoA/acyl-ACP dehydrogenase [Pseudomonadota bacterium]